MNFRVTGLSPEPFRPLFGLDEATLAACGFDARHRRHQAWLFLIASNCATLRLAIAFCSSTTSIKAPRRLTGRVHAIFVREGVTAAFDRLERDTPGVNASVGTIPPPPPPRLLVAAVL